MTGIGATLSRIQGVSVALFLVASIVSITAVQTLTQSAVSLHGRELNRLEVVEEIADTLAENRIAEAYQIFSDTPASRELLARRNRELNSGLGALKAFPATGAVQFQVGRLASSWRNYLVVQRSMGRLSDARRRDDAVRMFEGPLQQRYDAIDRMTDTLVDQIAGEAGKAAVRARDLSRLTTAIVLVVCGAGAVLAMGMLLFVRRRIVRPLANITASLSELASGDLDVVVNGGERRDEIGAMVRSLEVFRSHAKQLNEAHWEMSQAHARAEALARHDALTGLPNRRLFIEALMRATQAEGGQAVAVLLIDLDRFKPINDVHGHRAGDLVLCELAERFAAHREELAMVARLGGDEFAAILPIRRGADDAVRAARLISKIISEPIALDDGFVEVGATIGIALFPQDGADPAALLRAADLAMYEAKTEARGTIRFFKSTMHDQVQDRALLDADLRRAISEGEIRPHYQPLVSLDGGDLVGFEILARWHHPERGIIMPDVFIPAADERGLLSELTYRLLRRACLDARRWPAHLRLSLNLAPSQLRDPALGPRILAILTETGMSPARVEIEVTENALIGDLEASKAVLTSLQNLGMTIALDDFGTGYSSLYHLQELKFDKIKIDKSFVRALEAGEENG